MTSNSFIFDNLSSASAIPRNPRATIANAAEAERTTPIAIYACAATNSLPSVSARYKIPTVNIANTPITQITSHVNLTVPPKPSICFPTCVNIMNAPETITRTPDMPNIANVAFSRLASSIFDKAQTIPVIAKTNIPKIIPNSTTAPGSSG